MSDDVKKTRKILMTPQAALHVEALRERTTAPVERRRMSYTDRLSQLQTMADRLGEEIQVADADLGKRLNWLRDYAKLLPLLERAERKHNIALEKRNVEDLTDEELRQANRDIEREGEKRRKSKR